MKQYSANKFKIAVITDQNDITKRLKMMMFFNYCV